MAKKEITPLNKEQVKKLAKIGIKGIETVEEGRTKMIAFLKKNEVDDVDDDSFEDLYDMCEAMYEDTEDAVDNLAEEVDKEDKKKKPAKKAVVEDDEDVEEEESEDEEEEEEKPKKKAATKKVEEKPAKKASKKVVDEEEEETDEDDSEEEEEEKPAKKSSKKVEEKPAKKASKKEKGEKVSKRLDPLNNEEDAAKYDGLKKALGKDFEYNFIANGGVSVKHIGKNNKKVFMSFDSPKVDKDGQIVGRVYLSSVRDEEKLVELFGDDYKISKSWSGNMLVNEISLKELIAAIKGNKEGFDAVINSLSKKDEKLGKNREKMESDLKKGATKKAEEVKTKKAVKK